MPDKPFFKKTGGRLKLRKIILAGGSGGLGRYLNQHFTIRGAEVVILTRNPDKAMKDGTRYVFWDGKSGGPWQQELEGAEVLINLTGKNVNCRFTPENQHRIIDSRLKPIQILGQTLRQLQRPPTVWIQAAGISIYGDTGEQICDEQAKENQPAAKPQPHAHFLAEVCQQWEAAFAAQAHPTVRQIALRISSVLAPDIGALKLLAPMTRWGLGGAVWPGSQFVSWIHITDLVRAIDWLIENQDAKGAYNLTAPLPVTNQKFMADLRRALRRPWSPPVPKFALKLGCLLLQTEPVLALASIRAVPRRLQHVGFHFRYPELPDALLELYQKKEQNHDTTQPTHR